MSFKNKNIVREFPFFSHFACLPLIGEDCRQFIMKTQLLVEEKLAVQGFKVQDVVKRHNFLLGHLTLFMLTLRREDVKEKLQKVLTQEQQQIKQRLANLKIHPQQISYFTRQNKNQKCNEITVIYLQIDEQSSKILRDLVDYLVRILLSHEIIVAEELKPMRIAYNHKTGKFQLETFHVSLFRCRGLMQREGFLEAFKEINEVFRDKNEKAKMRFFPQSIDVSTMMAFDETEFYQPFYKIMLSEEQKEKKNEKK